MCGFGTRLHRFYLLVLTVSWLVAVFWKILLRFEAEGSMVKPLARYVIEHCSWGCGVHKRCHGQVWRVFPPFPCELCWRRDGSLGVSTKLRQPVISLR